MDDRSRQNPAYRPATERAPHGARSTFRPLSAGNPTSTRTLNSRVRNVILAGLAGALALTATAEAADEPLLTRFAPVLRYDSAEHGRATAVEALTARRLDASGRPGDTVALRPRRRRLPDMAYGRAFRRGPAGTWLQYWFLYAANPQDRGIVRTGRHEGDWEVVQVRVDARQRPRRVVFAQHSWAEACGWDAVEHRGAAPIVYVGHASHASYAHAGDHDRAWPD